VHPTENSRHSETKASPVVVGAIPARYGSTRLPAKALAPLAGRPMIEHVWRRVRDAEGLDRVVVLTDDERIAAVVREFGGDVELTPEECASGTDRIAWAAARWDCGWVINVQGDEPLIAPDGISRLAAHLVSHPEDEVATLAADALPGDLENPDVVKVVLDRTGRALYFSRAGIPYPRRAGEAPVHRHLGIYGYRRDALLKLARLAPTPLERAESLEQLRALENGMQIRVLTGARASQGVDTAEDAAAAAEQLAALAAHGGDS